MTLIAAAELRIGSRFKFTPTNPRTPPELMPTYRIDQILDNGRFSANKINCQPQERATVEFASATLVLKVSS